MIQTLLEVALIVFAYPYFYTRAMTMSFELKLIILVASIVVVHLVVGGLFWLLGINTCQIGGGMGIQTAIGNQKVMQVGGMDDPEAMDYHTNEQRPSGNVKMTGPDHANHGSMTATDLDDLDATKPVHAAPVNEVNIIERFMDDRMALNHDNEYASNIHESSTHRILQEQVADIEGYMDIDSAAML